MAATESAITTDFTAILVASWKIVAEQSCFEPSCFIMIEEPGYSIASSHSVAILDLLSKFVVDSRDFVSVTMMTEHLYRFARSTKIVSLLHSWKESQSARSAFKKRSLSLLCCLSQPQSWQQSSQSCHAREQPDAETVTSVEMLWALASVSDFDWHLGGRGEHSISGFGVSCFVSFGPRTCQRQSYRCWSSSSGASRCSSSIAIMELSMKSGKILLHWLDEATSSFH